MPRRLTAKEIISVLSDNDFVLIGQKGSHQKWQNPCTGAVTIVPCHGNNQIPIGTAYSIIRASKLDKSLFGF
ncbi:MAG: type II toxin-antitoxin system HicA family toxin [Treponema sp.]|nr:type II toxin-antitoxin system HicA family toxin [Treponema sp.]